MTSNDVTRIVSRLLSVDKVGHTGTLDPGAAGVLPVCLGKATRIADFIMSEYKTYRFEMVFGIETDTHDAYGNIVSVSSVFPDESSVMEILNGFKGDIEQIPPAHSAIKVKGEKLYELAREGIQVEVPIRSVNIKKLELVRFTPPNRAMIEVVCSKGTYIRSLCRDIGRKLGSAAYMAFLLRCASGNFSLDNSYTLNEVKQRFTDGSIHGIIVPMEKALENLASVIISTTFYNSAINGNYIPYENGTSVNLTVNETSLIRVFCNENFIGLGKLVYDKQMIKMEKVLI